MPPQNMPLWYFDYFKLKALEKHQTQGQLSETGRTHTHSL